jgi:hypothetical protein
MTSDARIPVALLFDPSGLGVALAAAPPAAIVVEGSLPAPQPGPGVPVVAFEPAAARHAFGCACCAGRSPAAVALDRLFQQRVRGHCAWFGRVVALVPGKAGAAMLRTALREDRLTAARFRLAR